MQNCIFFVIQPTFFILLRHIIKLTIMICQPFDIQKQNDATLVLRHFIQRSARLLPIFAELKTTSETDFHAKEQYDAIVNLFSEFNYDDQLSQKLLNSDILDRIRASFYAILNARSISEKEAENILAYFFEEYQRLMNVWIRIEMN